MTGSINIDMDRRAYVELGLISIHGVITPIKFKFDTGADRTTISVTDLKKLGYTKDIIETQMYQHGSGSLANGEGANHFAIKLTMTNILGQIIPKGLVFPFLCMRLKHVKRPKLGCSGCALTGEIKEGFRSLIGNDILSCFDVEIVHSEKKIYFERLKDLRERNSVYHWCEMHSLDHMTIDDDFPSSNLF